MTVHAPIVSDAEVPGLHIALDRAALLELLSEHLPECSVGTRIHDGRIEDVQYTPGAGARVLWKLTVAMPESSRRGRQLVAVGALRRGEAQPAAPVELIRRYGAIRARSGMVRTMPLRTPWLGIPAAGLVVHAFPLDPDLPTLLDITDPVFMKQALQRSWRPQRTYVQLVSVEALSYSPAARVALRYDVVSESRDNRAPDVRRLVGKLDCRRTPTRLFAGHWAIWSAARNQTSIARPAGYLAVSRLSLQDFVVGTRVSDLAGTDAFAEHLSEAARLIADVHALRLPLLAQRSVQKEMATVDRWAHVLTWLRPEFASRIQHIRTRLHRELALRMRVTGAVHADFHMANMLACDGAVTLIDWDQAAHGDPMVDVGRVLASLQVSSLRVYGKVNGLAAAADRFLETYLQHSHEDERRARLFEAASLLIAAAGPFRLQRDGWEEGADAMLAEVERTLDLSTAAVKSGPVAQPRRAGTCLAPALPDPKHEVAFVARSRWAADARYVQALLVPLIQESCGSDIEVTECQPKVLVSDSDRLLVRWILKGYRGADRWRGIVQGIGYAGRSGHGLLARLGRAAAMLGNRTDVLQLPVPIGHLGPLSMVVVEPVSGEPLKPLLGTAAEASAVALVATALARFNTLDLGLSKTDHTGRDVHADGRLHALGRRIERLPRGKYAHGQLAGAVFDRLDARCASVADGRGTVVRGLQLDSVRVSGESAAATLLSDVVVANPLIAVGDLLAEMHAVAVWRGQEATAAAVLRRTYAAVSGVGEAELAVFEAMGLLYRACARLRASSTSRSAATLLGHAASIMEIDV